MKLKATIKGRVHCASLFVELNTSVLTKDIQAVQYKSCIMFVSFFCFL